TILDNDSGGGPLNAPSNLTAQAQSTSEILLNWSDNSTNEIGFRIEQQSLGGAFAEVATTAANATSIVIGGLNPATFYNFRVRAAGASGFSPYSKVAGAATNAVPAPCVEGLNTLCVTGGRFKVEVTWKTSTGSGMGIAVPLASAPASGLFYFFDPTNIELLVKVLNACVNPFNRYWVFFAATTNVQFTLTVTDTQTGIVQVYFNPLNTAAAPVQDTSAFATCP
ncbi:MAG TPA: fibronectin type III domain-containing protein, partial [Thermoanaerobaculia bacterium]|nr:fibronectin type III domain-containing protein [Thermoanaerobaculia bacterium]